MTEADRLQGAARRATRWIFLVCGVATATWAPMVPFAKSRLGLDEARLLGRPALTCHAFTGTETGRPSGFTLHIPVRHYARHDGEALARATTLLGRYGMDTVPLWRALAAVTSRRPEDGVGLLAYLALAHQQGRPPRVTAYISSEAYHVRPPMALRRPAVVAAGR